MRAVSKAREQSKGHKAGAGPTRFGLTACPPAVEHKVNAVYHALSHALRTPAR